MLALMTRSAHPLIKSLGCSCIHEMSSSSFCTKSAAELRKEQHEFEKLENKINNRLKGLHEELQQFNDQLQKKNSISTVKKSIMAFESRESIYREEFSSGDTKFSLAAGVMPSGGTKFRLAAGFLLSLFYLYNRGEKDEKEPNTETKIPQ